MEDKEKSGESPKGLGHSASVLNAAPFTPGPWDYEREPDSRDLQRPWVGRLSEGRFAALACGANVDEAVANARLIAAAPDLYEALRQLADNAEVAKAHLQRTEEAGIVSSALFDTISQARAALAKVDPKVAVQEDLK